jgi:hypothetical protein
MLFDEAALALYRGEFPTLHTALLSIQSRSDFTADFGNISIN